MRRERAPRDLDLRQFRHDKPRNQPRNVLLMCTVSSSPIASGRSFTPRLA
jgi:hypothetical protein